MTRPPAGAADSRGPGTASAVAIIPIAANPHAAFMTDVAPPCLVRLRHVPQTRRSSALSVSLTGRPDVRVSSLRTDEVRSGRAALLPKLDLPMRAVAQWLVRGVAAPAEGHAIARLEGLPVRSSHRDPARDPQGSRERALLLGDGDRHRQVRLDVGAVLLERVRVGTRGAAVDQRDHAGADVAVLGPFQHGRDPLDAADAERRVHAQGAVTPHDDPMAVEHALPRSRRLRIRGFRAVETDPRVRPVAEGLRTRLPASTKGVRLLGVDDLGLVPREGVVRLRHDLRLAHEWDVAVNEVRAVAKHDDPLRLLGCVVP